jgi:hypothetical protein
MAQNTTIALDRAKYVDDHHAQFSSGVCALMELAGASQPDLGDARTGSHMQHRRDMNPGKIILFFFGLRCVFISLPKYFHAGAGYCERLCLSLGSLSEEILAS